MLEYRLQVLGDEEGVDGVAADLGEADEDVDDLGPDSIEKHNCFGLRFGLKNHLRVLAWDSPH